MNSKLEENIESLDSTNSFLNYKLVFMNIILTLSFFKLPYLILAFFIVVIMEFFILNIFWKKPLFSFKISFIGNVYSCLVAIPFLYLFSPDTTIWRYPGFVGKEVYLILIGHESTSSVDYFDLVITLIVSLLIFGIAFVLTFISEYAVLLCFKPSLKEKKPLFIANIASYSFIFISIIITGIFSGMIDPYRKLTDNLSDFIVFLTYDQSILFLYSTLILMIVFLVINILIIIRRKNLKVNTIINNFLAKLGFKLIKKETKI